jgi:hypothetical protein
VKIELRNIKHAEFASQETNCYSATLIINGEPRGQVSNEGHGGADHFTDHDAERELNQYAATLPPKVTDIDDADSPTGKWEMKQTAETLVTDIVTEWLIARDVRKSLRSRIVWLTTDGKTLQTKRMDAVSLARALADPTLKARLRDCAEVLNLATLDRAIAVFKREVQS